MSSHDIGRDRGGVREALGRVTAKTLVLGIDSDRLFPVEARSRSRAIFRSTIDGGGAR